MTTKKHDMGVFERYLTLWVGLCIILGILLGGQQRAEAEDLPGACGFGDRPRGRPLRGQVLRWVNIDSSSTG